MEGTCGSETVALLESLAKRWMLGTRNGNGRSAWEHPADVAKLTGEVPGVRGDEGSGPYMEALAWGHDLLEDGVKENGAAVTAEDLRAAGVPEHVVFGLTLLTKEKFETTHGYYRKLDGAPDLVRIVKCCDRIANLREAAPVFTESRWKKYVEETKGFTMALTLDMPAPYGKWLAEKMEAAMAVRPV